MNKAVCGEAGGRERVNNWSDGCCYWDQLQLYHPSDDQTHITWLCVFACIWRMCVCVCLIWLCLFSWVSSSTFHTLICHFHGNPVLQGLQQICVFVHVCFREKERERDRKRDGEGGQERERVIEWTVHYHGQLYWIKMADGGWEHIRGAYIIQHLIEGAGWKRCRVEKKGKMHRGNLKEEGMKKRGDGGAHWDG